MVAAKNRECRIGKVIVGLIVCYSCYEPQLSQSPSFLGRRDRLRLCRPGTPIESEAVEQARNQPAELGQIVIAPTLGFRLHHDYGPERAELALSQHPFAIVLSCADSRVSPELAFDQSRGRLFVIRLAGNFVDDNGLASAEYGTAVLGASLIVVLGHSECGAIKATIDVITKNKELPGHLPTLVSYLKPPVEQALKQGGSLEAAIRQNVATNVEKLKTAGPVIAPLVEEKKVEVVGALYDLRRGRVEFLS